MDSLIGKIHFLASGAQKIALAYGALKMVMMGIHYMTKNRQKLEEAQEGIKNVGIGVIITVIASSLISWLTQ